MYVHLKFKKMENLSNKQWKELIAKTKDYVVLDVRTSEECDQGILPEAIQIDFLASHDFVSAVEDLDKSKTYFVYCRSGNRSAQACLYMNMKGFKIYNLTEGITAWDGEIVTN